SFETIPVFTGVIFFPAPPNPRPTGSSGRTSPVPHSAGERGAGDKHICFKRSLRFMKGTMEKSRDKHYRLFIINGNQKRYPTKNCTTAFFPFTSSGLKGRG